MKEALLKLLEKLGVLEDLIKNMPIPPEVEIIDTKITAMTGELKAKLGIE